MAAWFSAGFSSLFARGNCCYLPPTQLGADPMACMEAISSLFPAFTKAFPQLTKFVSKIAKIQYCIQFSL